MLATTRQADRLEELDAHGVHYPLLDDGAIATQVRRLVPGGVDAALELVGTPTLPDTLAATRVHGTVCFAGMLSQQWTIPDFYPIDYLPNGVRLSAYDSGGLDPVAFQRCADRVASGDLSLGPVRGYGFDDVRKAYADMESNAVSGRLVVLVDR